MSRLADIGLKCDGNQYGDMICMEHPTSRTHPRMSAVDRAAQFAPFAALSGFEEAIRQAQARRGYYEKPVCFGAYNENMDRF